jgi:chaperonin GroEL
MAIAYAKVKSVAKNMLTKGEKLDALILDTMAVVSKLVGGTLGPGGHPVLIERQENNLANMVTKDGVTVFKSLGFVDPARHAIMESARDASVRTANEAGDGTTTATILAYAIVKRINEYCKKNPSVSPQRVIRRLEKEFRDSVEPSIRDWSIPCKFGTAQGNELLWNVAKISANGDEPLATAVMECFNIVGDGGNVTITEINGPSAYEVEKIEGYPINIGYEDSCSRFSPKFINDPGTQRVILEKPVFVLYHGRITDIQSVVFLMEAIGAAWQNDGFNHNVVLVATGFSESVLAQLALNFAEPTTINVYPLLAPLNAIPTSQLDFIDDVAAITGAEVFDQINNPLPRSHEEVRLDSFGKNVRIFEAQRFRSTIIGQCDEVLTLERVDIIQRQLEQSATSSLESSFLEERIGKLTGGIAKLKVVGASNGELREKRDRAEDAVMAVRKAIQHGCLPGGGHTLLRLCAGMARAKDEVLDEVLIPALLEPVYVLFHNLGYSTDEATEHFIEPLLLTIEPACRIELPTSPLPWWKRIFDTHENKAWSKIPDSLLVSSKEQWIVYDALEGKFVHPVESGILDSTPAVLEAIRNSLSIASLLGTLGGTITYPRDTELERTESRDTQEFLRNANVNEANERM